MVVVELLKLEQGHLPCWLWVGLIPGEEASTMMRRRSSGDVVVVMVVVVVVVVVVYSWHVRRP